MSPKPFFKIFGERNTATIVLRQFIQRNSDSKLAWPPRGIRTPFFQARERVLSYLPNRRFWIERHMDWAQSRLSDRYTWKHAATRFGGVGDFADCVVIFTVRHPASWLVALRRRPYHAIGHRWPDFAAFVRGRWQTVGRERLNRIECTPVELYNLKLASYLPFMAQLDRAGIPRVTVRFEDFVADQAAVFERLRPHLCGPAETPVLIEDSTKEKRKDRAFYRDYYGNHRWRDDIAPADRDYIDAHIDWSVAGRFGYAPLASGDEIVAPFGGGPRLESLDTGGGGESGLRG